MKRLITGLLLAVMGGVIMYGGISYRAYITMQEHVYASWKSRNYVEAAEAMRAFRQSFLFSALDAAPRYRDEFIYRSAWVEAMLGNTDAGLKGFQTLTESPFVGADANFAIGVLSLTPENLQISKDAFWRALMHDPDHYKARVNYELLLREQKRQDEKAKKADADKEEEGDRSKDTDDSKPGDPNSDKGKPKRAQDKEELQRQGRTTDQFRFKDVPGQNQSAVPGPGSIRY